MQALELATPPLDGMILPGITRDSVICLARDHVSERFVLAGLPQRFEMVERRITMKEVEAAADNGTLVEMFGTGKLFTRFLDRAAVR